MPRTKKSAGEKSSTKHKKNMRGKKGGLALQQRQVSSGVTPIMGAALGATLGGLVGAAAAVAWKDKDTQEKIKTVASNLRDQAVDKFGEAKERVQHVADATKDAAQKELSDRTSKNN